MANNTHKKQSNEKVTSSIKSMRTSSTSTAASASTSTAKSKSTSMSATMRKVSLSTLATVLTAATCLGGQPILASSNILLPPTTAAFASQVSSASDDPNPWLHTPNILEYQRYRYQNSNGDAGYVGDNGIGDWDRIKNKSMMYAHIKESDGNKYLVFDVFFNNDGKSMLTASKQQQYVWQVPFAVADLNNGAYKSDTVTDLRFDFYKRNEKSKDTPATLSHDIQLFEHDEKKSFSVGVLNNSYSHANSTFLNTLGIRAGRSKGADIYTTFHTTEKKLDNTIKKAIALSYPYDKYSYGLGIRTTDVNYAVKLHCKVKLRPNATKDEIQNAFTWTNTSSFAKNTNSSYTFISGRTHDESFPRTKSDNLPPKLYFNGKELTDNSSSIDVYQGESNNFTFGTSDNSEKVTKFSVKGFPDFAKSGNVDDKNDNGMTATENSKHTVTKSVALTHKNGDTPVNSDYTITVSATDASGNTAEKKVTVHLKNLNQKYPSPTADALTVDWGHTLTAEELENQIKGNDGKDNNGKGNVTFIGKKLPKTKLSEGHFKRSKNKLKVTAKITYADGSSHTVDIPVIVKKPLAFEHAPKGSENTVTVGDELKQPSNYITLENNTDNKVKPKTVEWRGGKPNSSTIGTFNKTVRVNYTDGSSKDTTVTFNVKPKKPVIETDLNGRAKIQNQKVVVNVGTGFIPKATNTVTLYDAKGRAIGSTTEIKDGKATITVAGGIPAGNVYAVTNSSYDNHKDKITNTFNLSSDRSENHQATEDKQAPTLTANDATAKVGENLSFELEATDDIKIDDFNIAAPLANLVNGDFSRLKIEYQETKDNSKHRKVKITILGMKASEVGEHKLKFSVTDAAGNTTEKEVKLTVKQPYELKANPITVDLGHELTNDDAKKIFENSKNVPSGTTYTWVTKPETNSTGKEKAGKVRVSIPGEKPQEISVAVTVQDTVKPVIKVYKKGPGDTWTEVTEKVTEGNTSYTKIDTYHGDKCELKITATDNSGNVKTLTLNPAVPGETTGTTAGTGTDKEPKTLTLDGTTPLNTKPGEYTRTITAVDPSGNTTKVAVKFVVKTQADKYGDVKNNPVTYNMSDGTKHPDPKSGINATDLKKLPSDAKYSWAKEPDWNKPGEQTDAKVLITFPDGSTKKVDTKVTVKDDIAPVIENPATNQVKHDDGKMYYQFKVHKGEQFSIDINAYDNSGKISNAKFGSDWPTNITGSNISITNKDKNSAENPAKITITGTAQRDATITNSSDNKWSRELVVTDEASNKSTLNIQISVYTDAEEHTATASKVNNPANKDAIKDAIKITKYDAPNTPINKNGITFEVGNIPTKNGNYAIPVTVKYPDGSSSKIEVPIVVTRESNNYDPVGKTITVHWNSKEDLANKIKSFGKDGGLTWKDNNSPSDTPTVEIVNTKDVPSTDKPGESKVQVKVTYSDKSSDVATVTVKVLDPQSETYTPEGQTITIAYNKTPNKNDISNKITGGIGNGNGIKLKQGDRELTSLPEGASIAIDDKAKTVPDGTQPGTFDIPVTITYKDGSKSHATVKVTVGKPQSETHKPTTTGIEVGYNGKAPTNEEIIKKVTVPDKPKDTTITVDDNQTIDTKTPGTVNVKVTVTYPDGSEDYVEVPVTVGNPDKETYKPSAEAINKKRNDPALTADEIKNAVNTSTVVGKTPDKSKTTVELVDPKAPLPSTDKTGTTNVPVKVTYPDGSEVVLEVPVVVRDTDKDIYTPTSSTLEKHYGSTISEKDITDKVTVPHFVGDATKISYKVKDTKKIPGENSNPGVYTVPVTVTYPDGTSEDVDVNVTILNKDSDSYEPTATTLTKKHGEKISNDEITNQVSVPNYPSGDSKKHLTKTVETGKKLPDTNTPGESDVPVIVKYPDGTTDTVKVHVVVKDTDANTHTPQAEPLEKNIDSGKPSDDEITSKVKIPNWPKGGTQPTYSIADSDKAQIPTGDKAGKFEVPVTVTYPDGSKTVINVPIIIKTPDPIAKTGVTVPKGSEPKPEDMISNKDKFPDDTQFEWKKENGNETGKPDTKTAGNTQGTVVVTVPGQKSQEVTVKVNVVEPSASEVNVPQGTDLPDAKEVIKDSNDTNKYPSETTFTWKPEDKPDTNNPGAKNGKIIVTLPGQSPVEVPVTVNVLPTPVAKVVNVPQNGTDFPIASDVIKDSNDKSKFPEGTKFEWKTKPDTKQSGNNKKGTITVTVPGVNGKPGTPVDVEVTVNVNPAPTAQDTSVIQNSDPDPKNSIENKDKFPDGTTFTWGTKDGKPDKPDTSTTGEKTVNVVVTVPGQEPQTVKVKVNVTASPEGKDITVLQNNTPDPSGLISNKDKLTGATFGWKKDNKDKETGKPDTSKTGNQPGVVTITVPGMTPVDVPVNVLVVPNPKDKTVSVPQNGDVPEPKDMIANNGDFPEKTTFTWATNGKPSTSNTGEQTGTVVVNIPGIEKPVNVTVKVNVVDKNKPFINDGKAENKPDSEKTTITGKGTPGATIKVKNSDGTALQDGGKDITVTVNNDGNFTIDVPKQTPDTTLKLVPSKDNTDGTPVEVTVTAKPKAPTITVPSENEGGKKSDGKVTVTPTSGDSATVVTIVITAKPNPLNGPEQPVRTIVVKKGDDNKWKIDGDYPDGVTVDETTGEVKIPAKDLEDGSTITAVAKDKDDHSSDKAEKTTGFKTPQITQQTLKDNPDDSTKQIITGKTLPGAKVTVTGTDGKQVGTGTADKDGNFTITIPKQNPGTILLTPTNGTGEGAKTGNSVEITVSEKKNPTPEPEPSPTPIPTDRPLVVTPQDGAEQGSATVIPPSDADSMEITYTPEGTGSIPGISIPGSPLIPTPAPEPAPAPTPTPTPDTTPSTLVTIKVKKGTDDKWTFDGNVPEGVTVDPTTGKVTIPANKIKDNTAVTAKSKKGETTSPDATGTVGTNPTGTPSPLPSPSPWPLPGELPDILPEPLPGEPTEQNQSEDQEQDSQENNEQSQKNKKANNNSNKNDKNSEKQNKKAKSNSLNAESSKEAAAQSSYPKLMNTGVSVIATGIAGLFATALSAAASILNRKRKQN